MGYTSGPWYIDKSEKQRCFATISADEPWVLAQVVIAFELVGHPKTHKDYPQGRANALLISAAPELLEACKFVKAFFQKLEDDTYDNDPLKALRKRFHAPVHKVLNAAIAKAEGR